MGKPLDLAEQEPEATFAREARAAIDAALGPEERARLEAEGAALSVDEAVALARETQPLGP